MIKLLLDENISYRLAKNLKDIYDISHIKSHGLSEKNDKEIWDFAKTNNYTIVTNDSDFNDFSIVWGLPPKIIWLQTGNKSTKSIGNLLTERKTEISRFINETKNGILILK